MINEGLMQGAATRIDYNAKINQALQIHELSEQKKREQENRNRYYAELMESPVINSPYYSKAQEDVVNKASEEMGQILLQTGGNIDSNPETALKARNISNQIKKNSIVKDYDKMLEEKDKLKNAVASGELLQSEYEEEAGKLAASINREYDPSKGYSSEGNYTYVKPFRVDINDAVKDIREAVGVKIITVEDKGEVFKKSYYDPEQIKVQIDVALNNETVKKSFEIAYESIQKNPKISGLYKDFNDYVLQTVNSSLPYSYVTMGLSDRAKMDAQERMYDKRANAEAPKKNAPTKTFYETTYLPTINSAIKKAELSGQPTATISKKFYHANLTQAGKDGGMFPMTQNHTDVFVEDSAGNIVPLQLSGAVKQLSAGDMIIDVKTGVKYIKTSVICDEQAFVKGQTGADLFGNSFIQKGGASSTPDGQDGQSSDFMSALNALSTGGKKQFVGTIISPVNVDPYSLEKYVKGISQMNKNDEDLSLINQAVTAFPEPFYGQGEDYSGVSSDNYTQPNNDN